MVSHPAAARRTPAPRRAHSLDLVEVDADIIVRVVALHCHVYGSLVDACRLGQLSVLLEIPCFISIILVDDVHLIILVLSQANKHNIARRDPYLLSHLSSDVTCVEIKILRRVRAGSPRRPPRHRRHACSMAWRCRFLEYTRRTG